MNGRIKGIWVSYLRSDRFKQGNGTLYSNDFVYDDDEGFGELHCCLGVLEEIHSEEDPGYARDCWQNEEVLTEATRQWAGLESNDPVIEPDNILGISATYANDTREWSFKQIADAIEKNETL